MDTGNRFLVLKECMAPSTPASKRKDGTVMKSWENPIMNAAQYSSYGFDKKNVKPKKVKASGLNPVNKTINPKDALSLGQHAKDSGQARDLYNSPRSSVLGSSLPVCRLADHSVVGRNWQRALCLLSPATQNRIIL
jgi:hypothetical protein